MAEAWELTAQFVFRTLDERAGNGELPEDVKDQADMAFRLAMDHNHGWMIYQDEDRFRAGVGALAILHHGNEEITARIKWEMDLAKILNAATSGVPVDWDALPMEEDRPEAIGLNRIYVAVKKEVEG